MARHSPGSIDGALSPSRASSLTGMRAFAIEPLNQKAGYGIELVLAKRNSVYGLSASRARGDSRGVDGVYDDCADGRREEDEGTAGESAAEAGRRLWLDDLRCMTLVQIARRGLPVYCRGGQ